MRWLGFDWDDRLYFASDYFEKLYAIAEQLVKEGKAYVDSQTLEEIRAGRGSFYQSRARQPVPRSDASTRTSTCSRRMRAGEFPDGAHVLRAKIDMESPEQNMRDPVMYRIKREHHHRTGDAWCIYPMYDFAHGYSDAIEGVTHSICTLEFENHRPLYDWFLEQTPSSTPRPQQTEFARLNLTYMRCRSASCKQLVDGRARERLGRSADADARRVAATRVHAGGHPRVLRAHRRLEAQQLRRRDAPRARDARGFERALPRAMGVVRPLRVVLENYPEGQEDSFDAPWHPEDPAQGRARSLSSRVLYIDREDFAEVPPKGWFRLSPGGEVRLRHACIIKCERVVKDAEGEVVELRCTWDPDSRGGNAKDGRKIKGTLHWVSAEARRAGRGAPLRPPFQDGAAGRRGRQRLPPGAEPGFPGEARGMRRAGPSRYRPRRARAVRARRVFLPGSGLQAGSARLQSNNRAKGLLGREAGEVGLPVGFTAD